MRVSTQGLFRPYLKTFIAPPLPTRLTTPGSPRMLIVLPLKETVKPFYYKTNDSETVHNPLFFSFLSSSNNAGIVICNKVTLFSFIIKFNIALYCTVSKSLEKILYKQVFSIPLFIITTHLYLGLLYLLKWDSDQHESFGYFGHSAHINKLVYYIFHYLLTY